MFQSLCKTHSVKQKETHTISYGAQVEPGLSLYSVSNTLMRRRVWKLLRESQNKRVLCMFCQKSHILLNFLCLFLSMFPLFSVFNNNCIDTFYMTHNLYELDCFSWLQSSWLNWVNLVKPRTSPFRSLEPAFPLWDRGARDANTAWKSSGLWKGQSQPGRLEIEVGYSQPGLRFLA